MNALLKAAKIIAPKSKFHGKRVDILIEKGIISKISKSISSQSIGTKKIKEIQLPNLHVSCGWFDSSVSFGEPGHEERETIDNGLRTAALGGFTDVILNPNTNPVIDTNTDISFIKSKGQGNAVNLHPMGALTKESKGIDLAELFDMQNAGAIAFGDYQKSIANPNLLKIALQYAQNFDALICSFPQENMISGSGVANEENTSTQLGLKGNPALAEDLRVARDLFLLEYTGGKLHIPTISTAKSVSLIKEAKKKGLDVSCSVAIHNLILDDSLLTDFNTNLKVLPPLRTTKNNKALIKGLEDGTIDMITCDHNPIDIEHKNVVFEQASYGTIGLETAFGALNNIMDTEKAIKFLTQGRERFKINAVGIEEGEIANLALFNPTESYTFNESDINSASTNSAFLGKELKGKVYGIFANDQLILNS